ncbi:MAG: Uncharacterised protein [Synechococcus sp. MIT S9220]|nr:MAG: Uncharacterised protein [Synechococcus sp. MIT S9220]
MVGFFLFGLSRDDDKTSRDVPEHCQRGDSWLNLRQSFRCHERNDDKPAEGRPASGARDRSPMPGDLRRKW